MNIVQYYVKKVAYISHIKRMMMNKNVKYALNSSEKLDLSLISVVNWRIFESYLTLTIEALT